MQYSSWLMNNQPDIVFADTDDVQRRQEAVFWSVQLEATISKVGWFEHTNDWDFHYVVKLNNGLEDHIGDGASIVNVFPDNATSTDGQMTTALRIQIPTERDDEDGPDPFADYLEPDRMTYAFPLEEIHSYSLGYCS